MTRWLNCEYKFTVYQGLYVTTRFERRGKYSWNLTMGFSAEVNDDLFEHSIPERAPPPVEVSLYCFFQGLFLFFQGHRDIPRIPQG